MKKIVTIIAVALLLSMVTITAYADMGPKDELTITVTNPPSEPYYLDLLTTNSSKYENFYETKKESFNQEMLTLLYSYQSEGWLPAFTEGTGVPLWGDLVGRPQGETMVHTFGYVGLPKTYRIILVTQSGKVTVSDSCTRKTLQSGVSYDYKTGTVHTPPLLHSYLAQFAMTCSLTLLIEGIILLLFRIKLKENWKPFLLLNLLTQLFLTLSMGTVLIKSGPITTYLIQFPVEILILIVEAAGFKRFLSGVSDKRKIAYGIVANLVSWLTGLALMTPLFELLSRVAR